MSVSDESGTLSLPSNPKSRQREAKPKVYLRCGEQSRTARLPARFNSKWTPEPFSGCHLWITRCSEDGYGQFWINGRTANAHRVAWEMANGRPVPDGLSVCHRCDVRSCVNPDHLWLGTTDDNMKDKARKGRVKRMFGEKSHWSKLKNEQVLAIRASTESQRVIAARYGISQATVSNIKQGKGWSHLP